MPENINNSVEKRYQLRITKHMMQSTFKVSVSYKSSFSIMSIGFNINRNFKLLIKLTRAFIIVVMHPYLQLIVLTAMLDIVSSQLTNYDVRLI